MSDHRLPRRRRRGPRRSRPLGDAAPERRPVAAAAVRRHAAGGRDPRARRARRDGRGARAVRRARRHAPAPGARASPISTCATPPRPTRPFRTRSSRSSVTSRRIARPGRSRSGSRAFSSTAAWTGARRGRAATAGSRRREDARRRRRRPARLRRRRPDPTPRRACSRASAARDWPRPSTGSTAGSGPSSCCATTATARRGRSAR